MIDAETLDHDFDEELEGFGEPAQGTEQQPVPALQRVGAALIALGLLAFVLAFAGGTETLAWLGGWGALLATFGLTSLGAVLYWWAQFKDTNPGIKHDGTFFRSAQNRGLLGWMLGIGITGFYVVLYFYDELQGYGMPSLLERPIRLLDPLALPLTGYEASRWFLYGVLYTLAIGVFGVRMLMKYRHSRYHQLRTLSVMGAQFLLAWLLPNLLVLLKQPYMEFNGVWPLKNNYLWPEKVTEFTGAGLFGWALLGIAGGLVVATPVLTYFFGKRWYCSWVCGCGGLAETLGDPFRQLSDKSTRAWKIERWMIHSVLVFVLVSTVALWIDYRSSGNAYGSWSQPLRNSYGFLIGSIFSGVVGTGFYPLLGSRAWCRFGCPQAAILGLWQRLFSRFRITTNGDQCMSCGNCSTYCEMGIDVRSYAQLGQNIVRASCVGCGVCASVCPRGVLKLENGGTHADRFDGADKPVERLKQSLGLLDEEPLENRTIRRPRAVPGGGPE